MSAASNISFDGSQSFEELSAESREKFWRLDDVLASETALDLTRPLLPASLTRLEQAEFLRPADALRLNQITGKSYINLFIFVEEYIIRDVKRLESAAQAESIQQDSLARFAAEEVKHQALFQRFMSAFDRDFGVVVDVLDFADDIADVIMGHSPLAVLLTTFHLEIITQEHYLKSVAPAENIEPNMVSILRHHWLDEARHAAIDYLEIKKLCASLSPAELRKGLDEYLGILDAVFELLSMQATHDVAALVQLSPSLSVSEQRRLQFLQHQGYSLLFLELGLRHPALRALIEELVPQFSRHLDRAAEKFQLS